MVPSVSDEPEASTVHVRLLHVSVNDADGGALLTTVDDVQAGDHP